MEKLIPINEDYGKSRVEFRGVLKFSVSFFKSQSKEDRIEMSLEISALLTRSPEVRRNRMRIDGTGITVARIAILSNLGHSPEEIVRKYKHLSLAGIHAALAYYHANQAEIEDEIASDELDAARLESEFARQPQVA